jgi:hypothetical protein
VGLERPGPERRVGDPVAHRRQKLLEVVRVVFEIGVEDHRVLAPCLLERLADRLPLAAVPIGVGDPDLLRPLPLCEQAAGAVGGAVVDDHELVGVGAEVGGERALDRLDDRRLLVVYRHQD